MADGAAARTSNARRPPWHVQRSVLFALLLRELKTRFGGRWLGALWVIGEPLAHLLLLMLIFGYLRAHVLPGLDYAVFLLTGLMPFLIFKSVLLHVMDAIDANRGLFGYRQVKPMDAMLTRAALEVALHTTVYLLMLAMFGWVGMAAVPTRPLEVLSIGLVVVVAAFGLGVAAAVLTEKTPRARGLIRMAFFPLYLASGVMLPIHALPSELLGWLLWNPLLHAIEISRGMFLSGYRPIPQISPQHVVSFAAVSVAFGLSLYRVQRHRLIAT
jgi:capsular polysaccharide transport system permease protein